jgi:hypothetical protein
MRIALLTVTISTVVSVSAASAAEPIEGTWNFETGKVRVGVLSDGGLVGTVVEPTRFSPCVHRAGERMWLINKATDGYRGTHQWLLEATRPDEDCRPVDETRGKAVWRLSDDQQTLHFCSASPYDGEPTVDTNGQPQGSTRCWSLRRAGPPAPSSGGGSGEGGRGETVEGRVYIPPAQQRTERCAGGACLESTGRELRRTGCVVRSRRHRFSVRLRNRRLLRRYRIAVVKPLLNGRRLATLRRSGRARRSSRVAITVPARRLRSGANTLTARVELLALRGTKRVRRTVRLRFNGCLS